MKPMSKETRERARWFRDKCRACKPGYGLCIELHKNHCDAIATVLLAGLLRDQQTKKRRAGKMAYHMPPHTRRLLNHVLRWDGHMPFNASALAAELRAYRAAETARKAAQ